MRPGVVFFRKVQAAYSLVAAVALEVGVLRAHYNTFVLLTAGRTGSTMLADCLRQNPQVEMFYEVFSADAEPSSRKRRLLLENRPLAYLRLYVFKYYPEQIRAVGFKMHYYHCQKGPRKVVWDYLRQSSVKVIHLKRNLLKSYVSGQLARRSGIWHVRGETQLGYVEDSTISLDYEDCRDYLERTARWRDEFDIAFAHHEKLEVWYEDLLVDLDGEMMRIQNWLGVEPRALYPRSHKQVTKPLSDLVLNYEELKVAFQNSPWKACFDE